MPTSKPLRAVARSLGGGPAGDRPGERLERARATVPRRWSAPTPRRWRAGIASGSRRRRRPDWLDSWLRSRGRRPRRDRRRLGGDRSSPASPASPRHWVAAYVDGDLVYTASSMPIRDQEAFLPPGDADVLFLANRGANGIDGLISSGIGAAHASGRPTVIVTGDLGLLHDLGGLAALRDVSVPVRIVVVNNDGGGIFGFLPQAQAMAEERVRDAARDAARSRRRRRRCTVRPRAPPDRRPRRAARGARRRDRADRGQGGSGGECRYPPPALGRRGRSAGAPLSAHCSRMQG